MLPEIAAEELAAALDDVACDLLVAAGVDGPPVDAFRVAEALGIDVAWDDRQAGRARLVALHEGEHAARTSILLRRDPRDERRHWAVAHEIGEAAAHRVFARLSVDPRVAPPAAREDVANRLAGRLLLPTAWLRAAGIGSGWDIAAIKRRSVHASHELVARRILEMDVPVIVTVFDQNRISWRRSNVSGRAPRLSPTERRCQSIVHDSGQPATCDAAGQVVQGWAVHEDDWRREILRMEVDLDGADGDWE
jgi:Zn-dependent peptidase ImmA (M78 family)